MTTQIDLCASRPAFTTLRDDTSPAIHRLWIAGCANCVLRQPCSDGEVRTRAQLLAGGMTKREVSRLNRLLPEVYSTSDPGYVELCAAVILWKPTAVLSHTTAAWLWGLLEDEPEIVEATVSPSVSVRGPSWVRLHRRTDVHAVRRKGLPVVPIEHCLIDVATTLDQLALEALFDAAIGTRVNWRAVARLRERSPGRHGIVAVREQLRTCCPLTRSEPERLVALHRVRETSHLRSTSRSAATTATWCVVAQGSSSNSTDANSTPTLQLSITTQNARANSSTMTGASFATRPRRRSPTSTRSSTTSSASCVNVAEAGGAECTQVGP